MVKIEDPTGWTIENNPHKASPSIRLYHFDKQGRHWTDYFEFDQEGIKPVKCHSCLKRAEGNNGNCVDGGGYFICLPKDVREGKRKLPKPTRQSTLL